MTNVRAGRFKIITIQLQNKQKYYDNWICGSQSSIGLQSGFPPTTAASVMMSPVRDEMPFTD